MNLFENEIINILRIHTINLYESETDCGKKKLLNYNINLPTYELIFFISGDGFTSFANTYMHDTPNSVRYLPKGVTEGKYSVETTVQGLCIDIYFDTQDVMPDYAMNFKNMNELKPLFTKIYNIWQTKRLGYYTEAMSVFYEIIKKMKKNNDKYLTSADFKKIQPPYNYMLDNFSNHNFNYKLMCEKSGLSYDYFKELFIKQFKVPPIKYVTLLRIDKAKELLLTGLYSVTEIAESCGFENVYYFSTVFKKHTGISPKAYKNSI